MYSWINHHRAHTLIVTMSELLSLPLLFPVPLIPSKWRWIDVICLSLLQVMLGGLTQFGSQIKQKLKCVPCWEQRVRWWVRGRTRWQVHLLWFSCSSMAWFSGGKRAATKAACSPDRKPSLLNNIHFLHEHRHQHFPYIFFEKQLVAHCWTNTVS